MTWRTSLIRDGMTSLRLNAALVSLLAITSCAHGPVPAWNGDIWPGRPDLGGVSRVEDDGTVRVMKATDPQFKSGAWISYSDLQKVFVIIQSCKQWKKGLPMMSADEALTRFKPLIEDLQREKALDDVEKNPAPK